MVRTFAVAMLLIATATPQNDAQGVLRIKAVLPDAEGRATPVPRHPLLISDDPPTSTPRMVVTGLDGTATVRLRPGNYVVESDRPVAVFGKSYSWIQQVTIAAGAETILELTASNGDIEPAAGENTATATAASDAAFLAGQWQNSVVALWTETSQASGFVIDASGLIATTQRIVGATRSVEVQLTPRLKVAAGVLAYDVEREVAIIQVAPTVLAAVRPVPLPCSPPAPLAIKEGAEVYALGASPRAPARMTSGRVTRIDAHSLRLDVDLARGTAGGPVLSARGDLIGISTLAGEDDADTAGGARVVRIDQACAVAADATRKVTAAVAPASTPLPVEPPRPFPVSALEAAAKRRAGSLAPYQISSSGFDIAFVTPIHTYGAQYQSEQMSRGRTSSAGTRTDVDPILMRPEMDFANWSEYVWEFPPVLLIRVTPKMAEGFWTTVARAAARTQGVALPPMKRFKPGFSRMQVFCGATEVTPIHPFRLERRISETDAIYEGLYVLEPDALGPHCSAVRFVLFSEGDPKKGDTLAVDQKVIQQLWDDFAAYRAAG